MGGEKDPILPLAAWVSGSPPRGRGKAFIERSRQCLLRITPAWAGKSTYVLSCVGKSGDHPRVGGEKLTGAVFGEPVEGSPPRGRGKGNAKSVQIFRMRITPAWAGKSTSIMYTWGVTKDHPRVGGEKWTNSTTGKRSAGSPPRGRGKGSLLFMCDLPPGITPAWAGKRAVRSW